MTAIQPSKQLYDIGLGHTRKNDLDTVTNTLMQLYGCQMSASTYKLHY